MASNAYHFTTHWRMQSTREEIFEVLSNAVDLQRWWPSVYLDVQVLEPGDEQGIRRVVGLYTKGWLPYTLRWQFRVTEVSHPTGFALEAWGDFTGHGVWRFEQDGDWVNIVYDWSISPTNRSCAVFRYSSSRFSRPTTIGPWLKARRACSWSLPDAKRATHRSVHTSLLRPAQRLLL